MSKKIKNNINPNTTKIDIGNINSTLYKECNLVVDFSFVGAFISCECGDFSNLLMNEIDFIQHFRDIITCISVLSTRRTTDVFNSGEYRHCHKVAEGKIAKINQIINTVLGKLNKDESYYDQVIGGEDFFQIGLTSDSRLYGTIQGNVFRVYVIDYYHDLYYDQRKNVRNRKLCKFCPKTTQI